MKVQIVRSIFFIGLLFVSCLANETTNPEIDTTASPTKPTPPDSPATNHYNVTQSGNTICLMANMKVYFSYSNQTVNVTSDATVNANESTCSSLYVDFGEDSYFVMNFTLSSNMYELVYVEAYLGGNINDTASKNNLQWGKTLKQDSYYCEAGGDFPLNGNFTMHMRNVQLQAFEVKDNTFGTKKDCDSDLSPIIPIVVGAVLGFLVLIVIIAYLIGRRRSRSGYETI